MKTIILTRNPDKYQDAYIYPPINTVWNPRAQIEAAGNINSVPVDKVIVWSEVFINTIGTLILMGKLNPASISVIIDNDKEQSSTSYSPLGFIKDLPDGWFQGVEESE